MDVFIKSFNRPFYLDRCLRSLKTGLKGVKSITVMDDGTLQVYLEKLKKLHPDIRFVSSGADDGKFELVRQGKFEEIKSRYPNYLQFWADQIGQSSSSHVVVLEDDTWLIRTIDLRKIAEHAPDAATVKLWWGTHPEGNSPLAPSIPCGSFGPNVTLRQFFPRLQSLEDIWSVWLECMMIYRKELYYEAYNHSEGGVPNENDRLRRAAAFFGNQQNLKFLVPSSRCIAQGWAVPSRSDPKYHHLGIEPHMFLDCINEAWLAGRFDALEGFPFDYSDQFLNGFFLRSLPQSLVDRYWMWRKGFLIDGCDFYMDRLLA